MPSDPAALVELSRTLGSAVGEMEIARQFVDIYAFKSRPALLLPDEILSGLQMIGSGPLDLD
jgi:hypothetical protein